MKSIFLILSVSLLVSAAPWPDPDDPSAFSSSYNINLNQLPLNGSLPVTPWSDTYWPSVESGIAHRWLLEQSGQSNDFQYDTYSRSQLLSMDPEDLKVLSPAEKYDIFVGRYDYPIVHSEWQRTSPQDASWEGLCHGWAPAAYNYLQPNPITLTTRDNITLSFGSSDVKALLTYFLAEYSTGQTQFVGERCEIDLDAHPEKADTEACNDLNAGAFHIIISNQIGILQRSYVMDRDRGQEVWNQPVTAYMARLADTRGPSDGSTNGTVQEYRFKTAVGYTKEIGARWESEQPLVYKDSYDYWVEVDASGNIIGGTFNSFDRPDFEWTMIAPSFNGYFAALATIYKASTSDSRFNVPANTLTLPHLAPVSRVYTSTNGTFGLWQPTIAAEVSMDVLGVMKSRSGMYPNGHQQSWLIAPAGNPKAIKITFERFSTERYRDKVRIYEGTPEKLGALIAVLHGHVVPAPVIVNSPFVHISFSSDQKISDKGFKARYEAFY